MPAFDSYDHHRFENPCPGIDEEGGQTCGRSHDCLGHQQVDISELGADQTFLSLPCLTALLDGSDTCPEHTARRPTPWMIVAPASGLVLWAAYQVPLTEPQIAEMADLAVELASLLQRTLGIQAPDGETMAWVHPDPELIHQI